MENSQEKVKCPACGHVDGNRWGLRNDYTLYRSACGLVFMHPIPAQPQDIYTHEYFFSASHGHGYVDYDREKEAMRPTFVRYLKEVSEFTSNRKLLDVGAATGYFVELATSLGWNASGVEISGAAAQKARQHGLLVQTGTIHDVPQEMYNVITLWDVLEHVSDPGADIRKAYELLGSGGVLAVNTPDAGSWWARLLGIHWQLIVPPEHIHLFSGKALRILLEKNGFSVVREVKIGKSFSIPYVLSIASHWLGLPFLGRLSRLLGTSFLNRVSLPINLRDNMFVIAIKK